MPHAEVNRGRCEAAAEFVFPQASGGKKVYREEGLGLIKGFGRWLGLV